MGVYSYHDDDTKKQEESIDGSTKFVCYLMTCWDSISRGCVVQIVVPWSNLGSGVLGSLRKTKVQAEVHLGEGVAKMGRGIHLFNKTE